MEICALESTVAGHGDTPNHVVHCLVPMSCFGEVMIDVKTTNQSVERAEPIRMDRVDLYLVSTARQGLRRHFPSPCFAGREVFSGYTTVPLSGELKVWS